jgi:hypothetical protein
MAIVGISGDVRLKALDTAAAPTIYANAVFRSSSDPPGKVIKAHKRYK